MRSSSKTTLRRTAAATTMVGLACLFAAGCGGSSSSSSTDQAGVGDSYQQLASDLAKCADEGRACLRGAHGDGGPGGAKACFDQVKSCRDAERASDEALRKAIGDCVTAARQCQSGGHGDGGAARGACRDELRACIEKNLPPVPSGLPSGFPPVPSGRPPFQAPPCLQALSQCIQGGGTPADCVKQARACIMKDLMPGMSGKP
jgi:hypothetical protein